MKLQRKSFSLKDIEWKADKPGSFRARIATLGVVDHQGDVSLPGSFPVGKSVVISAYMHSSWVDRLPVGKGVIGSNEGEAWVDGEFFTNTTDGSDTYLTVKGLAEAGLGEWSYGYEVTASGTDKGDLEPYPGANRIIKKQDVFEASPVLVGAGINTGTESIKALTQRRVARLAERVKAMGVDDSAAVTIAQLDVIMDRIGDDTDEANAMIDTLMEQLGIPDPDDAAEEAEDAEEDANGKSLTYARQAKHAQASVQAFIRRSKSLADLRAKEGRTLSAANRDRLSSLLSALTSAATDIQDLLDSTADDGKANVEVLETARLALSLLSH